MLYNAGKVNIEVSVSYKTSESSVNKENKQKSPCVDLFFFLSLKVKFMQHYYALFKHVRTC